MDLLCVQEIRVPDGASLHVEQPYHYDSPMGRGGCEKGFLFIPHPILGVFQLPHPRRVYIGEFWHRHLMRSNLWCGATIRCMLVFLVSLQCPTAENLAVPNTIPAVLNGNVFLQRATTEHPCSAHTQSRPAVRYRRDAQSIPAVLNGNVLCQRATAEYPCSAQSQNKAEY